MNLKHMFLLFSFLFVEKIHSFNQDLIENISKEYDDINLVYMELMKSRNISKTENAIILRNESPKENDDSSFITFKETNPYDEWSFQMTFEKIITKFPEKASIQMWYTDNSIDKGGFYGSEGNFKGLMAGMEFSDHSISVIVSVNDGEKDYSNKEEEILILKDELSPVILADVKKLIFKVIYTKNNFKIEIYDNDKGDLIFDALRFYDISELGKLERGKHISISSSYENVPPDKNFKISSFKLYERIEGKQYNKYYKKNSKMKDNEHLEIQHALSSLEYFMNYIHVVFGKPEGATILQSLVDTKNELKKQSQKLENLKANITNDINKVDLKAFPAKINQLDIQVGILIREMEEMHYIFREMEFSNHKHKTIIWIICGILTACGILYVFLGDNDKTKTN